MNQQANIQQAAASLRSLYQRVLADSSICPPLVEMLDARDEVLGRFQSVFSPANLPTLTEADFCQFLRLGENKHWKALHRRGAKICEDMPRLRQALSILFDESRPITERLNELVTVGKSNFVPYLGKAILTPLLLVQYPDRYGVWNRVAESAMTQMGIWPEIGRKQPFGERYRKVNDVMQQVAELAGVDLWTLDGLWWAVGQEENAASETKILDEDDDTEEIAAVVRFGLERHLHDFLRDNWHRTELGPEWALHEEDGDPDAGYEYVTSVGKIDLLTKHKNKPEWLVIELKRNQSSDRTVGQLLRYMGWVQQELAEESEVVRGLIIAHTADEKLRYALSSVQNVEVKLYEVDFRLKSHSADLAE